MKADAQSIVEACSREGDCLIWPHGTNNSGHPILYDGQSTRLVRRIVFEAAKGWLPEGRRECIRMRCRNLLCMNEEHMRAMTRSELIAEMHAEHKRPYNQLLKARIKQGTVLDIEKARAIRKDSRTLREIAADYGIGATMVRKIKAGECWKEDVPPPPKFIRPVVPIERPITEDWMSRRQGADIPSRFPPEFWAQR